MSENIESFSAFSSKLDEGRKTANEIVLISGAEYGPEALAKIADQLNAIVNKYSGKYPDPKIEVRRSGSGLGNKGEVVAISTDPYALTKVIQKLLDAINGK
jgi:hypothetical protein